MKLGKKPSFLIVCFRFIGDVLVTTPLAVSIKRAIPDATIDYLVFEGTEGVLEKNPYINKVITISRGGRSLKTAALLWNRYDMAIATGVSDRMVIYSSIAGRKRVGPLYGVPKERWKRQLLSCHICYDDSKHAVWNILATLAPLGIPAVPHVTMGYDEEDIEFARQRLPAGKFLIFHPYSRNGYKFWPSELWAKLAGLLTEKLDSTIVFTVTPSTNDREQLNSILRSIRTAYHVFPEPFSLSQMAGALSLSAAFVGIDTVVTHIAAAVGTPAVALYGPTLTRYWAPWPNCCSENSPFAANKGIQRVGSVTVVQKDWTCVPCNMETCVISNRSKIECMEEITPEEVLDEILKLMSRPHNEIRVQPDTEYKQTD